MLMDNLGYGDLGCYGSRLHRTPTIDRMAREGMRLTSFYSTSGVCTPSRASLMTGCYPRRVNLHISGRNFAVLRPVPTAVPPCANSKIRGRADSIRLMPYAICCV